MLPRLFCSQLRINVASGVVTTAVNTGVLAVGYPLYLHFLGYEQYGLWLVLSVVLSLAQLGNLGIGPAVTRLVAEDYGRGDREGIQHYVATALALLCLSGVLMLLVLLLCRGRIVAAFRLNEANARIVASLIPYIGLLSLYVFVVQVPNAVLAGLGRMDLANYVQTAGRIVGVGAAALLLCQGFGVVGLLLGNALSCLVMHVLSLVYVRRITRLHTWRRENLDPARCGRLLRIGANVFGASLIGMLGNPFNKLMLSRYAGVAAIPVYDIAYTGSMQVRYLLDAGLRALVPEVSRLGAARPADAQRRIAQVYHRSLRWALLLGIPLYAGVALCSPLLLHLWLRDRCVDTLPDAFRIMLIGTSFVSLVGGLPYYVIMGCGKVRRLVVSNLIAAGCNCLLVTAYGSLTGHLSARSIGWCTAVSCVVSTAYLMDEVRRLLAGARSDAGQVSRSDEEPVAAGPVRPAQSGGLVP
jgi:O-antigen/teichoic acid export membrane protein